MQQSIQFAHPDLTVCDGHMLSIANGHWFHYVKLVPTELGSTIFILNAISEED